MNYETCFLSTLIDIRNTLLMIAEYIVTKVACITQQALAELVETNAAFMQHDDQPSAGSGLVSNLKSFM